MIKSKLHYYTNKVSASVPPLVILHGLLGSGYNFKSILSKLKYPTIAFDLRNHGKSFHVKNMEYSQMADDVAESLADLGIKRCLLMGHSMGGKVALNLAALNPQLLEKLIIEDIAPISYTDHTANLVSMVDNLQTLNLAHITQKSEAFELLKDKIEHRTLMFLLTNLKFDDQQGFYWQVNLTAIKENMHKITGFNQLNPAADHLNTFWIAGKKSHYLTPSIYQSIQKDYPNSTYFQLDAGHWVHYEKQTEFIKLLEDIIN